MLRFFFYLSIILFPSCLGHHLLGVEKKVAITAKNHLETLRARCQVTLTSSDQPEISIDSFVGGKDDKYKLDFLKILKIVQKRFARSETSPGSIIEPWHLSNSGTEQDFITPQTLLSGYEENKKGNSLKLVKDIVLLNCHFFMGMQALCSYANHEKNLEYPGVRDTFNAIERIACTAQDKYRRGEMFGEVMYQAMEAVTQYMAESLRALPKQGYKTKDNFYANAKIIHADMLSAYRSSLNITKAIYDTYIDAPFFLAHARSVYRETFDQSIMLPAVGLLKDKEMTLVAQCVVEAIHILGKTENKDEARQKVDEIFKNAEKAPKKTNEELLAEIEGFPQSSKKGKGKNQKQQKKQQKKQQPSTKGRNRAEDSKKQPSYPLSQNKQEPQEDNTRLQPVWGLQDRFNKKKYDVHSRIRRWDGATIDEIKKFDGYADLSEKDIMWQKACHDLQGVELLLFVNDHADYFFNTPKGKSAFATFEVDGSTYEGMLEIGISDKGVIYHMMFNDQVKHKPEQLFQMIDPTLEYSFEDSKENNQQTGQWCNRYGYEIEKQNDKYVITLDMPSTTYATNQLCRKLFIHPNKLAAKCIKKS